MIGKIQRVRLREVWRHEALDFTTWLEENVDDVLNDALDRASPGPPIGLANIIPPPIPSQTYVLRTSHPTTVTSTAPSASFTSDTTNLPPASSL